MASVNQHHQQRQPTAKNGGGVSNSDHDLICNYSYNCPSMLLLLLRLLLLLLFIAAAAKHWQIAVENFKIVVAVAVTAKHVIAVAAKNGSNNSNSDNNSNNKNNKTLADSCREFQNLCADRGINVPSTTTWAGWPNSPNTK